MNINRKILIKNYIKAAFLPVLQSTGIVSISNRVGYFLNEKKIVLNYHNVSPTVFDEHLEYLTRNSIICTPETFFKPNNNNKLMILLTFDDGYKSFVYDIQKILIKYKAPALFFIPTGIFENNDIFFFDLLKLLIEKRKLNSLEVNGEIYKIDKTNEVTLTTKISAYLKEISNDSRQKVLYSIQHQLMSELNEKDKDKYRLIKIDDIKNIDNELVYIGSHGVTHELFSKLTNSELEHEIKDSKETLEKVVGKPIKYFAYPSGDYTIEAINTLKRYGYTAAFTTREGYFIDKDMYEINRISIDDKLPVSILSLKISLLLNIFRKLEKLILLKGV